MWIWLRTAHRAAKHSLGCRRGNEEIELVLLKCGIGVVEVEEDDGAKSHSKSSRK